MKALVLGAGTKPSKLTLDKHIKNAELIVCADGAVNWAIEYGLKIDAVLGDMDSVSSTCLETVKESASYVGKLSIHKNEIDSQEAIDYALKQGASEIIMLGMSGTRLDQTLANIQLLVRIEQSGAKGWLCDDYNEVCVAKETIKIIGQEGTVVSILPLCEGIVINSLNGLKYPLNNVNLELRFPRTISNVFAGEEAVIDFYGGWIAVFFITE